jgi:FtsP/CotA-like multicopper oxidase with cupredoxin domain
MEVPGGFHFYHPHRHGVVAEQYWAGLAGALILDDPADSPFADMTTHIMILKDISLSGSEPAPHSMMMDYMHGKEGNIIMVNGQVNPELRLLPGEIQRWRVLNASSARWYRLKLSNHQLHLVGTDGHWLDRPYARSEILMAPGERVDVLVQANGTSGLYKLYSMPYSRMGNMTSAQITLLTMNVTGSKMTGRVIPSIIDSSATRLNPDTTRLPHHTLALSMGSGRGYINGISFQDMDNAYMIMSELGTYEVWTIINQSGMDHPFHQHVNPSQILSVTGADSSYPTYSTLPAWKDVVLVPKWGSVTMLVPVMDWPGMTMFHCHILEHEDIGMMGMWHLMGMPM